MAEIQLTDKVKREIGQHFVFGFHGHELSDDIVSLVRDYHVGNVILMKRNVQDVPQVHRLIRELQKLAKDSGHSKPLLIGIDQENGLVSAFSSRTAGTQFPGAMALAASGSIELTEQVSLASGKEMRLAGINWAYSPVADINSDPRNPVIGVRSFGDDPEEVAGFAEAVARGLTSAGIAPCPKHFAGHGDTHVDSHLALPTIMKAKNELAAVELVPFRRLIADNVPTIMTGHMALPLVTGNDIPCSLSKIVTTELLRRELGFEGVITTDCLEMEAVAEKYGAEGGAVMSLQAGADIVMICHRFDRHVGALKATYEAVQTGDLTLHELIKSGERIAALKDRFAGSWEDVLAAELNMNKLAQLKEENTILSARAYTACISLIQDPFGALPMSKSDRVLIFAPRRERVNAAVDDDTVLRDEHGRMRNTAAPSYTRFVLSVRRRGAECRTVVYGDTKDESDLDVIFQLGTSVIFTTRNADRATWQLDTLRYVLSKFSLDKVVVLATCNPYDLLNAADIDVGYLATFEYTPEALEAAAAVIFGEQQATGRVPVLRGKVTPSLDV